MGVRYRVMIIDNDRAMSVRYKNMPVWQEAGFEISSAAASLGESIRSVTRTAPDLVVCCNKPPMIEAAAVIKELKSIRSSTVFIVISPYADAENMRECFLQGAVDYLTEPMADDRLSDALKRAKEQLDKASSNYEYARSVDDFFDDAEISDETFREELKEFFLSCENVTATTEYAADHFRYNKDYFGRIFKAKAGMTFSEFYNRFRMRYAERLLVSGRYKIYEVSELLGFASVDYFSSVFKKITGRRPSDLKKH